MRFTTDELLEICEDWENWEAYEIERIMEWELAESLISEERFYDNQFDTD